MAVSVEPPRVVPPFNVLDDAMFGALQKLLDLMDANPHLRIVVLESAMPDFASRENTRLGQPEVGAGVHPGGGGAERLSHLVGRGRALEIILGRTTLMATLPKVTATSTVHCRTRSWTVLWMRSRDVLRLLSAKRLRRHSALSMKFRFHPRIDYSIH